MHEICMLIPHAKLIIFIFISIHSFFVYILICLFLSYYYCFYLVILLLIVVVLYKVILFMHGYMKSSQIHIFTGNQLKRPQTKLVLKSYMLCYYVLQGNSNEAFPKSRCCSVIILFWFNKQVKLCKGGMVYMFWTHSCEILGLSEWQVSIDGRSHIFNVFFLNDQNRA